MRRDDVYDWMIGTGAPEEVAAEVATMLPLDRDITGRLVVSERDMCRDCGESHLLRPTFEEVRYFARRGAVLDDNEKKWLN